MESISFTLENVEYSATKPKLRKWLELEELSKKIRTDIKDGNVIEASNSICSCLLLFIDVDISVLKKCFWLDISKAYLSINLLCVPKRKFPILFNKIREEMEIFLDYPGRAWYIWANLLASNYGWSLEYIADLDFEDGIALIQEIILNKQLDKEWQWSLSEIAYPYNKSTKKSEFKPLPRPDWMTQIKKQTSIQSVKLPADMLPTGMVLRWEDNEKIIN